MLHTNDFNTCYSPTLNLVDMGVKRIGMENCIWMLKILQTRNQRTTKLSMEKAREIRSLYAAGGTTYRKLAAQFGVVEATIGFVVKNKKWKEQ